MNLVRITPLNRPIRSTSDWRRKFTQAELDANAVYCAEMEALREEFRAQWTSPSPLPPDDPEDPKYYEAHTIEWGAFECWLQRRKGYVAAATKGFWVDEIASCWLTDINDQGWGLFDREATTASVTLPFHHARKEANARRILGNGASLRDP